MLDARAERRRETSQKRGVPPRSPPRRSRAPWRPSPPPGVAPRPSAPRGALTESGRPPCRRCTPCVAGRPGRKSARTLGPRPGRGRRGYRRSRRGRSACRRRCRERRGRGGSCARLFQGGDRATTAPALGLAPGAPSNSRGDRAAQHDGARRHAGREDPWQAPARPVAANPAAPPLREEAERRKLAARGQPGVPPSGNEVQGQPNRKEAQRSRPDPDRRCVVPAAICKDPP